MTHINISSQELNKIYRRMEMWKDKVKPGWIVKVEWNGNFRGHSGRNAAIGWVGDKSNSQVLVLRTQMFRDTAGTGDWTVGELHIPMAAIRDVAPIGTITAEEDV